MRCGDPPFVQGLFARLPEHAQERDGTFRKELGLFRRLKLWTCSPLPSLPLTNAGDTILSQHGPVFTETDDFVALGVHVAFVYLTVTAV